ncbi:N-acetylneuraminate synthase family protein [Roseospirillum parvum]|uniref:N-acetylneuraminate synthase n=1 Tax=Roseospirillum parvum TaxID=83401 RepID=A0A1G8A2A1_9PROT|nr:N-acetylneuraminate synthase family protein [Roseospirillum parvum]SDH15059.1 N-acetylneuraminate synthase [Roseospirillum parvum]
MTKSKTLVIGDRSIGPGHPCYLIVEVGTTCLGDIDHALALVEAGAAAGVDAVKFQVIDPDQISDPAVTYTYRSGGETFEANMKEMFSRLAFSEAEWQRIADHCAAHGVHFFATVDYPAGVDLLDRLGAPAHKLGAWDATYKELIEKVGATGKPTFVDLGPATEQEVAQMAQWFQEAGGSSLIFLHDYHTSEPSQMNMRAVQFLDQTYPWPVGYSSPGLDHDLDFLALGLGATCLEKRLILSRQQRAFHADESLEPDELKDWVARIRRAEASLGTVAIRPSDKDLADARKYYRSLCTLTEVKAGEAFTADNLGAKRPADGLAPARLTEFLGRRAARDLPLNTLIGETDAE